MLYGNKRKVKQIKQGNFSCPQCGQHTTYRRFQDAAYLTILFVALVKRNDMVVDYLECDNCKRQFHTTRGLVLES
jgi:transcription elongation factor Elf1